MTVFDPSLLHRLVDDVSGRGFALEMARTYQRMLDGRLTRVIVSVGGDVVDLDECLDAVLSLKVSSAMTGTSEVAELARTIEMAVRQGDLPAARAEARMLVRAAADADRALSSYLDGACLSS